MPLFNAILFGAEVFGVGTVTPALTLTDLSRQRYSVTDLSAQRYGITERPRNRYDVEQ